MGVIRTIGRAIGLGLTEEEEYRRWLKRTSKCPGCGKKTWVRVGNPRFRQRSYDFVGKVVTRYACERCGTRVNLLPNGKLTD